MPAELVEERLPAQEGVGVGGEKPDRNRERPGRRPGTQPGGWWLRDQMSQAEHDHDRQRTVLRGARQPTDETGQHVVAKPPMSIHGHDRDERQHQEKGQRNVGDRVVTRSNVIEGKGHERRRHDPGPGAGRARPEASAQPIDEKNRDRADDRGEDSSDEIEAERLIVDVGERLPEALSDTPDVGQCKEWYEGVDESGRIDVVRFERPTLQHGDGRAGHLMLVGREHDRVAETDPPHAQTEPHDHEQTHQQSRSVRLEPPHHRLSCEVLASLPPLVESDPQTHERHEGRDRRRLDPDETGWGGGTDRARAPQ